MARACASEGMPPHGPTQDDGDVGEGSESAICSSDHDVSPTVVQMKESKTTTTPYEAEMAVQLSAVPINTPKVSFTAERFSEAKKIFTPRAHAQQGVKQSFCPSVVVVVVVNTKMARSA